MTRPMLPLACPLPLDRYPTVTLAHGGGGRLMQRLIGDLFRRAFDDPLLARAHDGATFDAGGRIAMTTDTFVVQPLVFPGGDIGRLAVYGTVNDLAMCGARPAYLSVAFVLEEGLPMERLWQIVRSMRAAADDAGVRIVTGDTKVVERGKGDEIFINTTGIGLCREDVDPHPALVRQGDVILVSGDIGRHGMAVMAEREGLRFETTIESDLAPLGDLVTRLLTSGAAVHCLRDPTRGGLAAALHEIADAACLRIDLDEAAIPVRDDVRGACEVLGLDPLHVACEGRLVACVPAEDETRALAALRAHPLGIEAARIGMVAAADAPQLTVTGPLGTTRVLDLPSGDQLPRIC